MMQLDFNLPETFDEPHDLTGWNLVKRSFSRGVMLLVLATLSWVAVGAAAWFLLFGR